MVADIVGTQRAVDMISKAGSRLVGVHCDVADSKSCDDLAPLLSTLDKIDILVNNAASFASI